MSLLEPDVSPSLEGDTVGGMSDTDDGEKKWSPLSNDAFFVKGKKIEPANTTLVRQRLDDYLVKLYIDEPFWARLSAHTSKVITRAIPTAAATWHQGGFIMMFNPDFIGGLDSAGRREEVYGVIKHELSHIGFGHLGSRYYPDDIEEQVKKMNPDEYRAFERRKRVLQAATDSAINTLLLDDGEMNGKKCELPGAPWVPGLRPGTPLDPVKDPLKPLQALRLALPPSPFDEAVMGAEKLQSTDYYYQLYDKFIAESDGEGEAGTDSHDMWATGSKRMIEVEAKRILKDAVKEGEGRGWGTVPMRMRTILRQMVSNEVNWQDRLRQWIGINGDPATRFRTRRRVDRKYPGLFPGVKRQRGVRVAVAIDQSASVHDALLTRLLAVIGGLSEVATITLVPFDTAVVEERIEVLTVGQQPSFERAACGGTDFDCITGWVNEPKNENVFDVLIIATDGEAARPQACRIPRVWVIGPGCKLGFETDEEVIQLSDETV